MRLMKNPLQNKYIVSCLAVAAGIALGWDHLRPYLGAPALPVGATTTPTPANRERLIPPPALKVADALSQWSTLLENQEPARDPMTYPGTKVLTVSAPVTNPDKGPTGPAWLLKAISVGDDRKFAVFNHTIVAEGEQAGPYLIEHIDESGVWVREGGRRLHATLQHPKPTLLEPAATENPPRADQPIGTSAALSRADRR